MTGFDYEICSLLCLPCMPTEEMVVYGYVICSIEVCALVYNSFDSLGQGTQVENLGCPTKPETVGNYVRGFSHFISLPDSTRSYISYGCYFSNVPLFSALFS